ncbi:MAG: sulfotransferase family 2 domain-containing protein [Bacteroidota bacterium]
MTKLSTKIVSRVKFLVSNSLTNYFSTNPIYVFHHIPKCGGSSFVYALREWFSVVKDYKTTHLSKTVSKRKNIEKFRSFQCLSGHFHIPGIYLHERYPEILSENRYQVFTILRDPLEVKISLYYYQRKVKSKIQPRNISLEQHLLEEPNWMAARFPCTHDNYQEVLSRYFFIGLLEYPQESIDRLAQLIGKKRIILPVENESKRDAQPINITPELVQKFKELNDLDYLIYEYCYQRFVKVSPS